MCAFVDKHRFEHGVEPICKALQIAPSTYYARRSRPESARAASDRKLGEKIESVHAQNYGVYGPGRSTRNCTGRTSRRRAAPSSG